MLVAAAVYWIAPLVLAICMGAGLGGVLMTLIFGWLGFLIWAVATMGSRRRRRDAKHDARTLALINAINPRAMGQAAVAGALDLDNAGLRPTLRRTNPDLARRLDKRDNRAAIGRALAALIVGITILLIWAAHSKADTLDDFNRQMAANGRWMCNMIALKLVHDAPHGLTQKQMRDARAFPIICGDDVEFSTLERVQALLR